MEIQLQKYVVQINFQMGEVMCLGEIWFIFLGGRFDLHGGGGFEMMFEFSFCFYTWVSVILNNLTILLN